MSQSPRDRGLGCGIAFLFLCAVVTVADIAAITLLGTNAPSAFQYTTAPTLPPPNPLSVAAPHPVETVEVPVAAKDLPVGTVLSADERLWVLKEVRRDALPAGAVVNAADLAGQRLTRPMRAGEAFVAADLNRGMSLPKGTNLVAIAIGPRADVSGFVVPGSRADVLALRRGDRARASTLLEDVLVVAVNAAAGAEGVSQVAFALTEKQALAVELARARGCEFTLKLRTAKPGAGRDLDAVLKRLEDSPLPVAPPPRPAGSPR